MHGQGQLKKKVDQQVHGVGEGQGEVSKKRCREQGGGWDKVELKVHRG